MGSRHDRMKEGLLHRPRLDILLNEAIKNPLVVVVAGSGYAKTTTITHFLQHTTARSAWIPLSRLDNFAPRFWRSFARAIGAEYEALSKTLLSFEFPDSMAKCDAFLRLLSKALYLHERPFVIVFDDFNNITNHEIYRFVETLVKAELDGLTVMINSNNKIPLEIFEEGACIITAEELKFTYAEIYEYVKQFLNVANIAELSAELLRYTEGWPLALYLIANTYKEDKDEKQREKGVNIGISNINPLFEREYFQEYDAITKKTLLQLSLLQGFSIEMIEQLLGDAAALVVEAVKNHMFIYYAPSKRLFVFQNMYQNFLSELQFSLNEDDILRIYRIAGSCYSANKQTLEAIYCFDACGDYDRVFQEILNFGGSYWGEELIEFFIAYLNKLPKSFCDENPLADYLKAVFYLNDMQMDESYRLLKELEQKIDGKDAFKETLGEIYISLGAIAIMRGVPGFADYYKKASAYLPNGSALKKQNIMISCNSNTLFLFNEEAGSLADVEKEMHLAVPFMEKSMNGAGRGMDYLFSAEAAYHTYNLEKAQEMARIAIRRAAENDQYDTLCSAKFLLAKVALLRGEYKKAQQEVEGIKEFINSNHITRLFDVRDCVMNWFLICMEDFEHLAYWISTGGPDDRASINRGRDGIEFANYLLSSEKYYELLGYCEQLEQMFLKRGMWIDRVRSYAIKAVAYLRIGEERSAIQTLHRVYEMTYKNNIIMPFIEGHKHMRSLIETVRKKAEHLFDEGWLDNVYQKSSTYTKKLAAMVKERSKEDKETSGEAIKLSKREMEVLLCLSQGLTREEIADFQNVSVNTIKSYVRNIYNKLGAINRADAVRLASEMGIVKFSMENQGKGSL